VRDIFIAHDPAAQQAFHAGDQGRFLADLYLLARQRLQQLGVEAVYGGQWCTFSQPEAFYSFRRDGVTGRMASLIWIA
jgi:copper oxidase (laccase) domain-containing protein